MRNTTVIIPSRLEAQRLPNKPLVLINGLPMIVHVLNKAKAADVGEVFVATPDDDIAEVVKKNGGQVILTKRNHATGSDRIFEAFNKLEDQNIEIIINLQGDMPNINPDYIKKINKLMEMKNCDLGTLASKLIKKEIHDMNVVKLETSENLNTDNFLKVKNFFRTVDKNKGLYIYYHIGIYAFTKKSLDTFINLKRSDNEIKRNLEQMRAIDNGLLIRSGLVDKTPIGVDTEEDFLKVTQEMKL